MDKTDPQKRIGMIVDEWGVWYDVEPGTNPGFLYQQNTLRDALVAGVTLNIFNDHCDRVKMANIAQLVNVLQSMILTDKERMLLTPTYHVFEMYKVHQDATLLPIELSAPDYKRDEKAIPSLHASASRDKAGRVHLSVINLDPHRDAQISVKVAGAQTGTITGRILTATTMDAHNTFDHPDAVKPAPFTGFERKGEEIAITLPSKSVVMLEIQ